MPDLDLAAKLRQWAKNLSPGGNWFNGGFAGLWYLNLNSVRSNSHDNFGYRPEELSQLLDDADAGRAVRLAKEAPKP